MVLVIVAGYGRSGFQQGERDERRPAARSSSSGPVRRPPVPGVAARLDHAVALFLTGDYRYLVVTGGGWGGDQTTEAAVARQFALERGVPDRRILVEDRGRTTLESLEGVATILRGHDLWDAVFVSDRTHMLRVLRMADDLGIVAWGSPTPSSPIDAIPARRAAAYVHELGALASYFVLGSAPPGELWEPR